MGLPFSLKFIAGKLQGLEVSLEPMGNEVIIGRAQDADVVIDESMISRRHARIFLDDDEICIQDMGSTNGTFVNGEKAAQPIPVKDGDRVLIGSNLIKLMGAGMVEGTARLQQQQQQQSLESPVDLPIVPSKVILPTQSLDATMSSQTMTMSRTSLNIRFSGALEEIPLIDLLQMLSTGKKSGTLEIKSPQGVGHIFLKSGQVVFASLSRSPNLKAEKAMFRMLVWQSGIFDLRPPDARTFDNQIQDRTDFLLLEGLRQIDEMKQYEKELPSPETILKLASPMVPPLRNLTPVQLDFLQVVHNIGQMGQIVDRSAVSDLETYEALSFLLKSGYIVVAKEGAV